MPEFNQLLNSRFSDVAEKLLGLQEQHGVTSVAPEMMPVVVFEMDRPEYSFLKREKLWYGSMNEAALAANFSQIAVINPTGSNLIVVVKGMIIDPLAANVNFQAGYIINLATWTAGTAGAPVARDRRWPIDPVAGHPLPKTQLFGIQNAAAQLHVELRASVPTNTSSLVLPLDYVLIPGSGFGVLNGTLNAQLNATFWGYERTMLPEEQPDT